MTVPSEFRLWFRLRFTLPAVRIAGLRLGCAGSRGFAFFDISIRTGNCL
jgi:hypothetical protein